MYSYVWEVVNTDFFYLPTTLWLVVVDNIKLIVKFVIRINSFVSLFSHMLLQNISICKQFLTKYALEPETKIYLLMVTNVNRQR